MKPATSRRRYVLLALGVLIVAFTGAFLLSVDDGLTARWFAWAVAGLAVAGLGAVWADGEHPRITWHLLILLLVVIGPLLAILVPNLIRARNQSPYSSCIGNLHHIERALDMYADDNHGVFPTSLTALVPSYLKRLPACPVAGSDTYSAGYEQQSGLHPAFTVMCKGEWHRGVLPPDFPQVTSGQGSTGSNHGGADNGRHYPQYTPQGRFER